MVKNKGIQLNITLYEEKDKDILNWLENQEGKTLSVKAVLNKFIMEHGDRDVIQLALENFSSVKHLPSSDESVTEVTMSERENVLEKHPTHENLNSEYGDRLSKLF